MWLLNSGTTNHDCHDLATTAGREGKSIGAMFVLGDHEEVIKLIKQLILNPFHGYAEEDRNILNPLWTKLSKSSP